MDIGSPAPGAGIIILGDEVGIIIRGDEALEWCVGRERHRTGKEMEQGKAQSRERKAQDIWAHVGVPGALWDPGGFWLVALSPLLGKLGGDPKPFHQTLKLEASQGPSPGRGGFLGRGCSADGRGRMWLFPWAWEREGRSQFSILVALGGISHQLLSFSAFITLNFAVPRVVLGRFHGRLPKRTFSCGLCCHLRSPCSLIPHGSTCWELGELRIWAGKVLAFNPFSGLF